LAGKIRYRPLSKSLANKKKSRREPAVAAGILPAVEGGKLPPEHRGQNYSEGNVAKVVISERLRRQTTATLTWIAARLRKTTRTRLADPL
jgi:hypothetical protein